jgi:hypothetical protein
MLAPTRLSKQIRVQTISTAEAFYRVFCALPRKDRLAVARYILEDQEIRQSLDKLEIPNETTLAAFAEDKATMPVFQTVEDLRKDLVVGLWTGGGIVCDKERPNAVGPGSAQNG